MAQWVHDRDERGKYTCFLQLTEKEVDAISGIIRREQHRYERLVDKYQDILEGGEATDKQTTRLAECEEKAELYGRIAGIMEIGQKGGDA